ncbi:MAG: tetratricopeptide repeat protein, partial [Desulfobacteraceae bacterium]|nr:tetratricopeptide repeat protein [Desulfobacteraceae bacterium]
SSFNSVIAGSIFEDAKSGIPEAQFELGTMYIKGDGTKKDINEAMKWIKLSADQNYKLAQTALGFAYYYGNPSVPQDLQKAINWFTKSATQNDSAAQLYLGLIYVEGNGVEKK